MRTIPIPRESGFGISRQAKAYRTLVSPRPFKFFQEVSMPKDAHDMSEAEVRSRVITLGFDGDERLFIAFYRKLQQGLPEGTGIVLRGSVVTNTRHEDSAPFDSLGKGTSDLDVTLVGKTVMEAWGSDAYYIPALHTKPLCDKDPSVAPTLNPLRESLQQ